MLKKIKKLFSDESIAVKDKALIERLLSDDNFPYLISFPRTGSHWLRMLMEAYFEKPGLLRMFFTKEINEETEFTCYHWHDQDLDYEFQKRVIYLYRNPVDTIYSQLQYHKEDLSDEKPLTYWTEVYAKHIRKWLYEDDVCEQKTVLSYEGLKSDLSGEFQKLCDFFETGELDSAQLEKAQGMVSKDRLKKKTGHDDQVVNLSQSYDDERQTFRDTQSERIMTRVASVDQRVADLFNAD